MDKTYKDIHIISFEDGNEFVIRECTDICIKTVGSFVEIKYSQYAHTDGVRKPSVSPTLKQDFALLIPSLRGLRIYID